MKLEEQVVSLELAKKLKELGVKQESLWYWIEDINRKEWFLKSADAMSYSDPFEEPTDDDISAFTVAELGEMLPEFIKQKGTNFVLVYRKGMVSYLNSKSKIEPIKIYADTEANARAKMLIYLKEKGLLQNGK